MSDEEQIERMQIRLKVDREQGLVEQYFEQVRFYTERINGYFYDLGVIDQKLGEVS